MPRRSPPLGVVLTLLLAIAPAIEGVRAQDLPDPVGKVNDFAAVLTPAQRLALGTQLSDLERTTSAEVAVVTMRTLGDRTVEEYATALFNTWGIGKYDRDNGVLILVAVEDRAMRIEVGYGLEGILPDGLAGAVIRESFLPAFRNDDYPTGILDGTTRIIEIVRRQETLTADQLAALDRAAQDAGKSWGLAAFAAIFVGVAAFSLGTGAGAQVIVQSIFGACFTAGALYLSPYIAPRAAVVALALLAIALAGFGFVLARRPKWRRKFRGPGSSSGWITDGGSSSSDSSSSGSSSDSFGGGSSGGGGASGHW